MRKRFLEYSISIVIPAYNEESNIFDVVTDSLNVLESLTDRYEVVVMDDASKDRTGKILDEMAAKNADTVRILHHAINQGTNLSLIELFRSARYELVFFLPADKQILPSSIVSYLETLRDEKVDIVMGVREERADPLHRLFFNWAYRVAMRFLLGLSLRDGTASDLYKKSILDQVPMDSRGRLLQAEIAAAAVSLGYKIKEIPVAHYPRMAGKQTGIHPKTMWLSALDLWQVGSKIRALKRQRLRPQG
ncbi:MAG TPA: glycosyltransferase family 2 protein [bacterium]|nr:glycosyltransferase family 2 protein [bacterium]